MSKFKFNTIEKLENAKTQLETIKRGIQNNTIDANSVILIIEKRSRNCIAIRKSALPSICVSHLTYLLPEGI